MKFSRFLANPTEIPRDGGMGASKFPSQYTLMCTPQMCARDSWQQFFSASHMCVCMHVLLASTAKKKTNVAGKCVSAGAKYTLGNNE